MSNDPLDDAIAKLRVAKQLCDDLIKDGERQRRADRLVGGALAFLIVACIISYRYL